jgi:hypothetical protein
VFDALVFDNHIFGEGEYWPRPAAIRKIHPGGLGLRRVDEEGRRLIPRNEGVFIHVGGSMTIANPYGTCQWLPEVSLRLEESSGAGGRLRGRMPAPSLLC